MEITVRSFADDSCGSAKTVLLERLIGRFGLKDQSQLDVSLVAHLGRRKTPRSRRATVVTTCREWPVNLVTLETPRSERTGGHFVVLSCGTLMT